MDRRKKDMRALPVLLTLAICLVFSTAVAAAEKEEVMLKDGTTAMVEVVATEAQSVTVKFQTKEGKAGQTKLHADSLDPHSFYQIRKKHMEKTAENHVKLAIFCAGAGLFNRAKAQMDVARALDPKAVEQVKDMPDVMNGIANYLVERARRAYKSGDLERAYEIASLIATRFPETEGGVLARGVLAQLKEETEAAAEKKNEDREAAIKAEEDAEKKKAAKAVDGVLDGLEKKLSMGQNLMHTALQERNQSRARRTYEAAAKEFTSLLGDIDKEMKKAADSPQLLEALVEMDAQVRNEAVSAWIAAGNVLLSRGSQNDAMKCAQKALAIDPDNSSAKSFMNNVQLASSSTDWGRRRGGRR
jgi:tetratricopeptide (TPR) repeat protein